MLEARQSMELIFYLSVTFYIRFVPIVCATMNNVLGNCLFNELSLVSKMSSDMKRMENQYRISCQTILCG